MKKILLCLAIVLGLFTLCSCDEDNVVSITYVDANGKNQTVQVSATTDKETIQAVLDFASKANYDDIQSFTLKESFNVSASLDESITYSLTQDTSTQLIANGSMTLNASEKNGFDLKVEGNVSFGKNLYAKGSVSALCSNPSLDLENPAYVYVDVSYDAKANENSYKATEKHAVSIVELLEEIEERYGDLIGGKLPDMSPVENDFNLDVTTVEDFYTYFKNSELSIVDVDNSAIYVQAKISFKDIFDLLEAEIEDLAQIKPFIKMNNCVVLTYGIDIKTGRFREYSVVCDDASILNFVLSNFIAASIANKMTYESYNFINKFHFETKITMDYNSAVIRTLTQEEQAKYSKNLI